MTSDYWIDLDMDTCNDGDRHQWTGNSGPEGYECAGCGVTEAELDQMRRAAKRRRTENE